MNHNFLSVISISIILIGCSPSLPYEDQKISLTFTEKIAFGMNDSLSEASLFSAEGVQAGPNGKIYVADAAQLTIKVYSKEGKFLNSFGQRGRGPGEFINIKGFSLIDNTIFVWDQSLQQLSLFSLRGKLKNIFSLKGVTAPIDIYPLGDSYLILHPDRHHKKPQLTKLAHTYRSNFSQPVANFLQIKNIDQNIEKIARMLQIAPGSICIQNEISFLYIPYANNGNIYRYSKSPLNGWQQTDIYKGLNQQDPITIIDEDYWRRPDVSGSSVFWAEPRRFILHNQSRGLLKFKDFYFHFTFSDIGERRVFGVEVYNNQLQPIGYTPIDSIPITNQPNNFLQWFVDDVDSKGNFYLRERNAGGSRVRILQIDMKDLQQLAAI